MAKGKARGHIRPKPERGPDAWEVTVSAGTDPATGRRRRKSELVHGSWKMAEQKRTEMLAALDKQAVIDSEGTVAQLLDEWWKMKESSWSVTTAHGYRLLIDGRLIPDLGHVRLCDLNVAQLDHYYGQLSREGKRKGGGLDPNSVRNIHSVLRKALRQAVKWGWVAHAATDHATLPTKSKEPVDAPTPDDLRRTLVLMDEKWPEFGVFVRLAATTGMRRGEMCGLRWADVDFHGQGEVRVRRSIAQVAGQCTVKSTKSTKQRRFSLDPIMVAVLKGHRVAMEKRAADAGVELGRDAYLFSREFDCSTFWKPDTVTEKWRRLRKQAGVESTLHDWRHFCASELLAAGVDVVTVAGRLGHSQTSTTLDIYAHVIAARDQDAAVVMGRLL